MFTRFGMHLQAETQNKCTVYRVWTRGNFKPEYNNQYFHKPTAVNNEIENCNNHVVNVDDSKCSPQMAIQDHNAYDLKRLVQTSPYGCTKSENTILNVDGACCRKTEDGEMNTEVSHKLHGNGESDLRGNHLARVSVFQPTCSIPAVELSSANTVVETVFGSTTSPSALLRPSISAPYQKYPCLPLTVGSAWREQRILERLQVFSTIYSLNLHCSLF